jgi:NADH dehydrogenase FAD-containing subunit
VRGRPAVHVTLISNQNFFLFTPRVVEAALAISPERWAKLLDLA